MQAKSNAAKKVGGTATVEVDGSEFTGRVYHVRDNGWACVETPAGHIASGPAPRYGYNQAAHKMDLGRFS